MFFYYNIFTPVLKKLDKTIFFESKKKMSVHREQTQIKNNLLNKHRHNLCFMKNNNVINKM